MDYWKEKVDGCSDRCDFLHLPKQFKCKGETFRNVQELPKNIYRGNVEFRSSEMATLFPLIHFAWHKALSVYGNGSQTITMTIKSNNMDEVVPCIVDHATIHSKQMNLLVGDALSKIGREMEETQKEMKTLGQAEIWENSCDSFVFWNNPDDDKQNMNLVDSLMDAAAGSLSLTILENNPKNDDNNGINQSKMNFSITYNSSIMNEVFIQQLANYFENAVNLLAEVSPTAILSSLEFLPATQKQILENWNDVTTGEFPEDMRLHNLVEIAAAATPNKVAVINSNNSNSLTYEELNSRANQLAHLFHTEIKVNVEQFVAIFMDKTDALLITILGIWKCGAAYIPIDPTYPDERVKFILEDTGAKLVISNEKYQRRLENLWERNQSNQSETKILLVEKLQEMARCQPKENLHLTELHSDQLCYVTYTSGTTGVPKGVYKEHKGIVNSITDLTVRYGMNKGTPEVVVLFSAYVWEPFVRQTLIALVNSQTLVIIDDMAKFDLVKFPQFLRQHKVTYLNGTGSVLQEFDLENCPSLTKLILVGEELTKRRYDLLRLKFKGRIICEYGFTESALVTCLNSFDYEDQREDRSIGRPLRNVKAYILDSHLKRVPIGTVGELFIGGVGITRGYMNRDVLTKERFLPNPFQSTDEKSKNVNSLIYKTGDLARWMVDGRIEYIGRNDFQVKLRGIRIEPGEIETIAMKYPGVENCLVAVKDLLSPSGESAATSRHLVGYFVASSRDIPETEVVTHLESHLPRYMIPARMVQVAEIKTNINGKADLTSLPEVDISSLASSSSAAAKARNDVDRKLINIWSEILRVPRMSIGPTSDLFRLGGHSISCIHISARIREQFEVELSVDQIFSLRTVKKMSDFISSKPQEHIPELTDTTRLTNDDFEDDADEDEIFIANSLQQGLFYHHLKQGSQDDAYLMQSLYQYNATLHIPTYQKAWQLALEKYPGLRVNFQNRDKIYQIIRNTSKCKLDWTYIDISDCSSRQDEEINRVIEEDRQRLYDLEIGSLFRITVLKTEETRFYLVFSYHHILMDGWSIPHLFSFVHRFYKNHNEANLSKDVAYIQSQRYLEKHRDDHLDYWRSEIAEIEKRADLTGLLKPELKYKLDLQNISQVDDQSQLDIQLTSEFVDKLKSRTAEFGVTLHSVLQFAWHQVLHAYGGGSHTVVGTIVSGRNTPVIGIEKSVGLFINTLPLVVDHSKDCDSIAKGIQKIQRKVNLMNERNNVELGRLGNGGNMKHSLFDSLFVLEPEMEFDDSLDGFELVKDYQKVDYPLAVIAREESGGTRLKLELRYAEELFEHQLLSDMFHLMEYLLQQIASTTVSVRDLKLVLPDQLKVMDRWNLNKSPFPADKTIHQVFQDAATLCPSKTALIYENQKWTYDQLNRSANQIANYLRSLVDLQPDDRIALILEKSDLLILAILGIWKAGAAFVPIDPSYPRERIEFMLQDTGAKLAIVNEHNEGICKLLSELPVKVVEIEPTLRKNANQKENVPSPGITETGSHNLCYIIYTSGTTGKPKGVMTEHRGVVNLHFALSNLFKLSHTRSPTNQVFLSFSNVVFDHFVEQMTDALLSGQTLLILNDDMRSDPDRLWRYMRDNRVTYLSGTPSVISMYNYGDLPNLQRIDCVGEDFTPAYFNKIRESFPEGTIINGYGPTECSITSHKRIYEKGEFRVNKSIGHHLSNYTCYILNESLQKVPVGAVGEIYLGGVGVGRGYLNREDLTSKAFISNPFATEQEIRENVNLRLYRTGDLGRFLENGEIECLGRSDSQVKFRGVRIELSEIEQSILSYPGVSRCAVVAQCRDNENPAATSRFLVGYYVSKKGNESEEKMLKFLRGKLPSYMVPNRLVLVETIPVNISGKCDTKALPKVDFSKENKSTFQKEQNWRHDEIEEKLRFIWSELLNLHPEEIGIDEDFFSLGGDSLLVTTMAFKISKEFGQVITVPQLFLHKTIKSLAKCIREKAGHHLKTQSANQSETFSSDKFSKDIFHASPAQERLLFIDEMEMGTNAFNVPFLLKLTTNKADYNNLLQSLKLVVGRHEALRTLLVKAKSGSYLQEIVTVGESRFTELWSEAIHIEENVLSSEKAFLEKVEENENFIFKLYKKFPFRLALLRTSENEIFLSIVFHHTCFDGWSFPVFLRDWFHFYSAKTEDLPKLESSYKQFSAAQRNLSLSSSSKLSTYWFQKLSDAPQLQLPTDFQRPSTFSYAGFEEIREISPETTVMLRDLAKQLKVSSFSIFASAFALTMSIFSGQDEILIGCPVAGRSAKFENVIGFFVNVLPLLFKIGKSESETLQEFIASVGNEVVTSHVHQDMPFDKLVKMLNVDKDLSRHPLIQVMLNFNPLASSTTASHRQDSIFELVESLPNLEKSRATTCKYDLSVTITPRKNNGPVELNFTYAKTLFSPETVKAYMDTFIFILTHVFTEPANLSMKISELNFVAVPNQNCDGCDSSKENGPIPENEFSPISAAFDEAANTNGCKTALIYKERHVTYRELKCRSDDLARFILQNTSTNVEENGKRKRVVAIIMNKSDWLPTAILSVWKAGFAYVPIDPNHPASRINFILKNTKAEIILTDKANYGNLKSSTLEPCHLKSLVAIDDPQTLLNLKEDLHAISPESTKAENLAYIIYTSGTTGDPKGVRVSHGNLSSFRESIVIHHNRDMRVLFLSNFVFDFSLEQLVLSIFNHGTLIIPENEFVMDDEFYCYLNRCGLTYLSGTPSLVSAFDFSKLSSNLKTVTVAGEKMTRAHFHRIRTGFQGRLINAYGVTESTIYNSLAVYEPEDTIYRDTLGQFLKNTSFSVFNKFLRNIPHGAVGELCLYGPCISDGYIKQPDTTRKHFIPSSKGKMYRTGDIVRLLPSGELQYLHRIDRQVKVRGLRIQLEEVECAVLKYSGVKQCSVFTEKETLVCIYILEKSESLEEKVDEKIKSHLMNILPSQLIPYLVKYEGTHLPLTVNGKLDMGELRKIHEKKHLRDTPSLEKTRNKKNWTKAEKELRKLFSGVLAISESDIHADSDFFRIGGDSISSLILSGKIRTKFGVTCYAKHVFELRTIQNLAVGLNLNKPQNQIQIHSNGEINNDMPFKHQKPSGFVPLLPIQKWFFEKHAESSNHWNQTFAISVPHRLNVDRLRKAVGNLVDFHDSFRLRFFQNKKSGEWLQFYDDNDDEHSLSTRANFYPIVKNGHSEKEVFKKLTKLSKVNLEKGPLYAVAYIEDMERKLYRIWWSIHHLIVDTVSWRIIKDDLQTFYEKDENHFENHFKSRKGMSYQEFSHYLRSDVMSNQSLEEKCFWDGMMDDIAKYNDAMAKKVTMTEPGKKFQFSFENKSIMRNSNEMNTFLLTALGYALGGLTGLCNNFVTLEGHGRPEECDLANTVGWFTTMYPFQVPINKNASLQANFENVRKSLLLVPRKGIGYGTTFGYQHPPLPCVSFNFLGMFDDNQDEGTWKFCDLNLKVSKNSENVDSDLNRENIPSFIMDVTAACQNDRLICSVDFNLNFEMGIQEKFILKFQQTLDTILKECGANFLQTLDLDYQPYFIIEPDCKTLEIQPKNISTLFILPPGEGGAESYFNNLVPKLRQRHRLVLFNNYYVHYGKPDENTFEQLASMHINQLKSNQPEGPYNLLGWSFGGVLALEMGRQLANSGNKIGNIFIIDSYFNVGKVIQELKIDMDEKIYNDQLIDKINLKYKPTSNDFHEMCSKIGKIILFKATLPNEMAQGEDQHQFFEYFRHHPFNNLDTWIPPERITIQTMENHSHISWTNDDKMVVKMSNVVMSTLY